jgi:hypothetical protein
MNEEQQEIQELRDEVARLQDLLDRRPAMNAGLLEAYAAWTTEVYASDIGYTSEGETTH